MSISYPLSLPSGHKTLAKIRLTGANNIAMSQSPYTFSQQVYDWGADMWGMECSLPPMKMQDAEYWISFLLSLRGRLGTFLCGDTARTTPQGSAQASTDANYPSPIIGGYGQAAKSRTLFLGGARASISGWLKAGDYLQVSKNWLPSPYALEDWEIKEELSVDGTHYNDPWGDGGSSGARRVIPAGGATNARLRHTFALDGAGGKSFQFSIWARAISGTPSIEFGLADYEWTTFISSTVALSTSWKRIIVTGTMASTSAGATVYVGGQNSWTEAVGSLDLWGASLTCDTLGIYLHKALADVNTDSSGNPFVDVWPQTRETYPAFSKIVTSGAKGTFRLADNKTQWNIDAAKVFGISFSALEAL